jgi:hypothetical protein
MIFEESWKDIWQGFSDGNRFSALGGLVLAGVVAISYRALNLYFDDGDIGSLTIQLLFQTLLLVSGIAISFRKKWAVLLFVPVAVGSQIYNQVSLGKIDVILTTLAIIIIVTAIASWQKLR